MFFATDAATVTHSIQLAVAPVFLLTAVAAMIGSVAGRLARIIDRARAVEAQLQRTDADPQHANAQWRELDQLRSRGRLVNVCIALLTLCGIGIGLTILLLFLGETTALPLYRAATGLFLGSIGCFLAALLCFLAETLIATRLLRFGREIRRQSNF
ncbi:MAG: DUF2721 domain-containing protein [Rhodoferax sp.]